MAPIDEKSAFKPDPNKPYRIGLNGPILRPVDDIMGFNFHPNLVILDNLRGYKQTKRLIDSGVVSETAPIARNIAGISSEREFIEKLRAMVYDVEYGITLEETLGGRDRFNSTVAQANTRLTEEQSNYSEDPNFYEPDNH